MNLGARVLSDRTIGPLLRGAGTVPGSWVAASVANVTVLTPLRLTRDAQVAVGLVSALLALAYAGHIITRTPAPPTSASRSESATSLTPPPRVLVIGDSYAAGVGSSSSDEGMVALLAERTGWTISNQARGGTGYELGIATNGDDSCGREECASFARVLRRTADELEQSGVRSDPDILLVIGGHNDVDQNADQIRAAITRFYRNARKSFPDARIVAVAPLAGDDPAAAELATIRSDVEESVKAVGGLYLDIGQPLVGKSDLMVKDGEQPNSRGHAALAQALLTGLQDAGILRGTLE